MRVSVRASDPGFDPRTLKGGFKILLDGNDVTMLCHTADEEEGRVYGYCVDDEGLKYVDPITDRPAERVLYGNVEIISMMNGARNYAQPG